MRLYELVLVFNPGLTEEKRKKLLETIKGWINDIKVAKEEVWGQKVLSYPIKHERIGFYHLLHLESQNGFPQDFEKKILGNESVLRHLLIRKK